MVQPLPFIPEPFFDELLSSWLRRIAAEYGMALNQLIEYLQLEASSRASLDYREHPKDCRRIANALRISTKEVDTMTHKPLQGAGKQLLSWPFPIQVCRACDAFHRTQTAQKVQLKGWFEYWTLECAACRRPLSPLTRPKLKIANPQREDPGWYSEILTHSRHGASEVMRYARNPRFFAFSPLACLELLSKRTGPLRYNAYKPNVKLRGILNPENHCIAELLIPGLSDKLDQSPLIPLRWRSDHPTKDVTARTLLLAALALFLANPASAWAKVQERICYTKGVEIDFWLSRQSPHLAQRLSPNPTRTKRAEHVSQLLQL